MPGNIVSINNWAEYYVGDSKMPKLIRYLNAIGLPENKEARKLKESQKIADKILGELNNK